MASRAPGLEPIAIQNHMSRCPSSAWLRWYCSNPLRGRHRAASSRLPLFPRIPLGVPPRQHERISHVPRNHVEVQVEHRLPRRSAARLQHVTPAAPRSSYARRASSCATRAHAATSSGSAVSRSSVCSRETTRQWPRVAGAMSMKATVRASACTISAGISPATILQKRQSVIVRSKRPLDTTARSAVVSASQWIQPAPPGNARRCGSWPSSHNATATATACCAVCAPPVSPRSATRPSTARSGGSPAAVR